MRLREPNESHVKLLGAVPANPPQPFQSYNAGATFAVGLPFSNELLSMRKRRFTQPHTPAIYQW
jgi:hypothetical protein